MLEEIVIRKLRHKMSKQEDPKVRVMRQVVEVWRSLPQLFDTLKQHAEAITRAPAHKVDELKERFFSTAIKVLQQIIFLMRAEQIMGEELLLAGKGEEERIKELYGYLAQATQYLRELKKSHRRKRRKNALK